MTNGTPAIGNQFLIAVVANATDVALSARARRRGLRDGVKNGIIMGMKGNAMETPEDRKFKALEALLDYSRGTLWWVRDHLWSEAIPNFVQKRWGHPGLSLARKKVEGLYSMIPMAIGTSIRYGRALAVSGLSEEGVHDAPTYFAVLRPHRLRFDNFGSADGIIRNQIKPRLTSDEFRRLDGFLEW